MIPDTYIRRAKLLLAWLVLCCWLISPALPAAALEVPPLQGRVNDYAGILSGVTVQHLDSLLANLEREESTQLVVLTIKSLEGAVLEEYSLQVLETWGLGQAGLDNGALLLIAHNDRRLRIEVGYGLEGSLTDLTAGRIISQVITPHFRQADFDQGVIAGVTAMIAAVHGEFSADQTPVRGGHPRSDEAGGLLVFLLFMLFNIGKILGRRPFFAGGLGAVVVPLFSFSFFGPQWLILVSLIPTGFVAGWLAATLFGSRTRQPGSSGVGSRRTHPGNFGGGFSGVNSGAGFGGGGGGGGGGGASGRW
jgi:uncharacterized protein